MQLGILGLAADSPQQLHEDGQQVTQLLSN
jgi:hypothetical protein